MGNDFLLERVLTTTMDESLKNDLLRHLFKSTGRKNRGIPMLTDCKHQLNSVEISERMKQVAGGTGVSVAKLLGISPQGFNNQIIRKAISGNSIIDFHLKTGVSVDWLIGSWDGSTEYIDGGKNSSGEVEATKADHPPQKYLSLVEIYNQTNGNSELKWCVTKHHICLDDNNAVIPEEFGALLSIIIRYRDEAGTPERVKSGKKSHFQVRRILAYVIGDPKLIHHLDSRAKAMTVTQTSGHADRPGKTEFRHYSAMDVCLSVFRTLADKSGLRMVNPECNSIAWDYLIGVGSISPQEWILNKLKSARSKGQPEQPNATEIMVSYDSPAVSSLEMYAY